MPGFTPTPFDGQRVRATERVTVTRVIAVEGTGIAPSPIREVEYWYDDDGRLIARRDGWEEAQDGDTAQPQDVSRRDGDERTVGSRRPRGTP